MGSWCFLGSGGQVGRRQSGRGVLGDQFLEQGSHTALGQWLRHRLRWFEPLSLAGGVGGPVERSDGTEPLPFPGVDEIDEAQVPAGVAQVDQRQVPIAGGDFEALAFQHHGAVGAPLAAGDLQPEGPGQILGRGTGPAHGGLLEVPVQGRRLDLAMERPVVFLLDPGLGGEIQGLQGEVLLSLEHRHQAGFHAGPEELLLAVLVSAVGQRLPVQDTQVFQALHGLPGHHGGAVVGHQGAGQAALHDGLAEAVDQARGGLVQVPLEMTDQAGAIVEDAEEDGLDPLAGAGGDRLGAVVEVEVPQAMNVLDFVTADFHLLQPLPGGLRPFALPFGSCRPHQAARAKKSADRGVGRNRKPGVPVPAEQIVVMELDGPAGVLPVLVDELVADRHREAGEAAVVTAGPILQHPDRIGGLSRPVIPAFEGGEPELDRLPGDGVPPGLGGQFGEPGLQLTRWWRGGKQRTDDREAQLRPAIPA